MENDTLHFNHLSREELESLLAGSQAESMELNEALKKALAKIEVMARQITSLQKMLFGKKSERYVDDGTPMLPGFVLPEIVKPDAEPTTLVGEHPRKKAEPHREAGWNGFPENLPREEVVLDLPEAEKEGLALIGYDINERLVHRQEYFVKVIKRAKYAAAEKPELGVVSADPLPNVLSEDSDRAHYDVSVAIHLIYNKFVNHLPFYRQSEDLKRHGIMIGRSLMSEWAMTTAFLLKPVYSRLVELVMNCPVIHADETSVRMLEKGKCKRCYIWVRRTGTGPPLTVFYFSLNRNQETAKKIMGEFLGTYVSDAYVGYAQLPGTRAGCWAHPRREFFEVPVLDDPDRLEALSLIRLMYMNERYAVEAAAAKQESEMALIKARKMYRKQTRVLVKKYFELCEKIIGGDLPPSDPLVKAANYSLKQRKALSVFLNNPRVGIDNNPAENTIRPWALGRKNWLFVGNERGGEMAAIINSLVMTCKENKIYFEVWLADILPQLAKTSAADIDTLMPHLWKPEHD